jgi:hypothetical protein
VPGRRCSCPHRHLGHGLLVVARSVTVLVRGGQVVDVREQLRRPAQVRRGATVTCGW